MNNIKLAELKEMREKKIKNKISKGSYTRAKNSEVKDLVASDDNLGEVENLAYIEVAPSSVISSFNFSTKK